MKYVTYRLALLEGICNIIRASTMEIPMMPVVRLNDATFMDLKSISTWFGTKTPAEAIDRIVREAMEQLGLERGVFGRQTLNQTEQFFRFAF